jgi:hypothetical protein
VMISYKRHDTWESLESHSSASWFRMKDSRIAFIVNRTCAILLDYGEHTLRCPMPPKLRLPSSCFGATLEGSSSRGMLQSGDVYRGIIGTKNVRGELEECRRTFDLLESILLSECMVCMEDKVVISQY